MRVNHFSLLNAALAIAVGLPVCAQAQGADPDLMGMSVGGLKDEIGRRYGEALSLTQDAAVVSADDSRYLWASQAKVQCGIALGFLKSGTKDPVSVGKCADAYGRMQAQAAVPTPLAPAPAPLAATCNMGPYIVFFEWDSAEISPEAATVLDTAATTNSNCGSAPLLVTGYTDRSGSNRYNQGLSERRAGAVRVYLGSRGIDDSAITTEGFGENNPRVPTADGVRELQNRRVEITVK